MLLDPGSSILVATHNAGKVEEFSALLAPLGIGVVSAMDSGLAAPEETESDFAGNARLKAHAAALATGLVALGDDSGIEVEALGGAPGVFTADWAETGGERDFGLAMEKVHRALVDIEAPQPWRARFRCVLVLAWPDGRDQVFEGSVAGSLVWPIRGAGGHGYDPMFLPDGYSETFAEMSLSVKNAISHRARALKALIEAVSRETSA